MASSLAVARAVIIEGAQFDVTNHYINREDHPCFGTQRRTIMKVNSASVWLSHPDYPEGDRVPWPKAPQVEIHADGRVQFYGHPHADDLFLTFTPVQ